MRSADQRGDGVWKNFTKHLIVKIHDCLLGWAKRRVTLLCCRHTYKNALDT